MQVVVCVDRRNGLLFNHRRQSMDLLQRQDLCRMLRGKRLYMSLFSYELYRDVSDPVIIADSDYLRLCGASDWCLIEGEEINRCFDRVNRLLLYQWNRTYPADVFFRGDLQSFTIEEQVDFRGSSHEKITRTLLERNEP